jgi:hypothetical protein
MNGKSATEPHRIEPLNTSRIADQQPPITKKFRTTGPSLPKKIHRTSAFHKKKNSEHRIAEQDFSS